MTNALVAGPVGDAVWTEQHLGGGAGEPTVAPFRVLTLPDAANRTRVQQNLPELYYYLPSAPLLAHDDTGAPVFSLSLLLSRAPTPDDASIADLITQGVVSFDVTLALPVAPATRLATEPIIQYQPLFARTAQFALGIAQQPPLATSGVMMGAFVRSGLYFTLDQAQTIDLLNALQNIPSQFTVNCAIAYRSAGVPQHLILTVNWAMVYDFLAQHLDPGDTLSNQELRIFFETMIEDSILTFGIVDSNGEPLSAGHVDPKTIDTGYFFPQFLRFSSILLQCTTVALKPDDPQNLYQLRQRPDEAFHIDLQETIANDGDQRMMLSAPLHELLANALAGQPVDQFIHLISPTGMLITGVSPLGPAPHRLRTPPRGRDIGSTTRQLAAFGGTIQSLTLALRPDAHVKPALAAVVNSEAIQISQVNQSSPSAQRLHWVADDVVLARPNTWWEEFTMPATEALPVVDDPAAALWHDRRNPASFWYAPDFAIVEPPPNGDPATGAFLFSYSESGHAMSGRPGLNGTIRFTLHQGMGNDTQTALQRLNNPEAHPAVVTDLTVWLELPFRDERGATRSQRFPATISQSSDTVTATVTLLDDWVRLAYGALAYTNFQSQPARAVVAYSHRGYVLIDEDRVNRWELLGVDKVAQTPVLFTKEDPVPAAAHPYLDATAVTYHQPVGTLHFAREAAHENGALRAPLGTVVGMAMPQTARGDLSTTFSTTNIQPPADNRATPTLSTTAVHAVTLQQNLTVVARPQIEPLLALHQVLQQNHYAIQSYGREMAIDLLIPCNTLGSYYRHTNGTPRAIGCQDAFQLGQTTYRQYELITDADVQSPFYQLYRSLQQPGCFLVVPTAYRITRYAPNEGDNAYRPVIYLYSTLDPLDATNNRAVVIATLQPDLPPYVRRDLLAKVATRAQHPTIEYVTAIESRLAYTWSVGADPSLHLQPQATKLWDGFQVSLSTDLDGAPQLQAMLQHNAVSANVTFTLPDGTQLQSALLLDLDKIIGPWTQGPVAVALQPLRATLTNQIERPVNLSDLALYGGDSVMSNVPVERTLAAGEAVTVALPAGVMEAFPIYTIAPGDPATLTEVRSFVEDIHTNVVFLNLINYANHNLQQLTIVAQIKGVVGTYPVAVSESQPVGVADITLPLTTYLTNRTLQFQATKTDTNNQVVTTPWLEWPLDTYGNVVSLTWELIGG